MLYRAGRVDPAQAAEAIEEQAAQALQRDKSELERITAALDALRDDPYFETIELYYFDGMTDQEISAELNRPKSKIYRNRVRLVKRLSVRLFGAAAL
jgi:RNA polymerase sigma factor (sigma-70 family)